MQFSQSREQSNNEGYQAINVNVRQNSYKNDIYVKNNTFLLTENVQRYFNDIIQIVLKQLIKLQQKVFKRLKVETPFEYIIQFILFKYRSRYDRKQLSQLAVNMINQKCTKFGLNFIQNMLIGNTLLGKFMRQNGIRQQYAYEMNVRMISQTTNQNIYYQILRRLLQSSQSLELINVIKKQQQNFKKDAASFTKQYFDHYVHKYSGEQIKIWVFNKQWVDSYCKKYTKKQDLNTREKAIVSVYKKYINGDSVPNLKYISYQLVQYLLTISNTVFQQEFQINDDTGVNTLIILINSQSIANINQLNIKASLTKHVEWDRIYISSSIPVMDISDDIIMSLLNNINNRILVIDGQYDFIIVRRIPDNKVLKSIISRSNKRDIEQLLQQCNDSELYDIIIRSQHQYENLSNVKIRYLNYSNSDDSCKATVTLTHPKDLISTSLYQCKISNMNQCVNLQNIYDKWNTYVKEDIEPLQNLKRLYSWNDEYQNEGSCFLEELFKANKPEFVLILNNNSYRNIIKSMALSTNISSLRYLCVEHKYTDDDIKLDVSHEFPANMTVYDVYTDRHYGTIIGPQNAAKRLQQSLIHSLK